METFKAGEVVRYAVGPFGRRPYPQHRTAVVIRITGERVLVDRQLRDCDHYDPHEQGYWERTADLEAVGSPDG